MDCFNSSFKPDKIDLAFFVFLLFIMVCNVTFCAEVEQIKPLDVSGLSISPSRNYFALSSGGVNYFKTEPGYIYHITRLNDTGTELAIGTEIPSLNGIYDYVGSLNYDNYTFDYLSTNSTYIYFYSFPRNISVTREKITDMNGVVYMLSNDVGTNQFWNVFTLAIPFILIVVIVVFGFFIIRRLTKKESKGDIRF